MLSNEKLKFLRHKFGYTKQYLADCIGCSYDMFKSMEMGRRGIKQEYYDKWIDALYGKIKPPVKQNKKKK